MNSELRELERLRHVFRVAYLCAEQDRSLSESERLRRALKAVRREILESLEPLTRSKPR